ncbi:unnamed protein product [Owenia fusiformis]|uniref:Uncharacterized protein n=1 Tax=Owenia fusiformis TaxID=6347 RepID=A0A8J1Y6L1_OWEFU|nr:unnamed protein product [Owenia fusiformis]
MDAEGGTIPIKPHLNTTHECRDINNDGTSAARCACGDLSKHTETSAINKTQSTESLNSEQDIKVKKKKKRKKTDKYEGMTKEEKTEYKERRRKRRQDKEIKKLAKSSNNDSKNQLDIRPEPEGSVFCPTTELDKIIHNNDPLFSDIEDLPDEPERPQRSRRRGFVPCLQLGVNSNTIIKFTIIGTEIQNVYANLRRVRTT